MIRAPFDLSRFLEARASVYANVLEELRRTANAATGCGSSFPSWQRWVEARPPASTGSKAWRMPAPMGSTPRSGIDCEHAVLWSSP